MAERDSWAVGGGVVDQQDARMAVGALWTPGSSAIAAKTGFRPGPGSVTPGTVYASGTPDGFVHVQPFQAALQTTRATPGGPFILTLDSVKDINVLSTPANATNPRNDLIIAHQSDTFYGDVDSQLRVRQVVGTPSATPSDPSLASYPDSITLARVRVNASATIITSGNITDLRPTAPYSVAVGGLLPVPTQSARDSLTGIYNGFSVWRQDRAWRETYDGTAWRVQGTPIVTSVADLSAITAPHAGLVASNSGDGLQYRYNGSAWRVVTYKATQTLGANATLVTFTGIPTYLRWLRVAWTARSSQAASNTTVGVRVNSDTTAANYRASWINSFGTSSPVVASVDGTITSAQIGILPANTNTAGLFGSGWVEFAGWDAPHANCLVGTTHFGFVGNASGNSSNSQGTVVYLGSSASGYSALQFITNGDFMTGSQFTITGSE